MKASLALNHKDQLALFYNEPLGIVPEWASVDIEQGEIYVGGREIENKAIKLDKIKEEVYVRVQKADKILLILVAKDEKRTPLATLSVPLMVSQQL
jgi:hypothetical protein